MMQQQPAGLSPQASAQVRTQINQVMEKASALLSQNQALREEQASHARELARKEQEIAALKRIIATKATQPALTHGKGGDHMPAWKRRANYQAHLAKAREAFLARKIKTTVEGVVQHCGCHTVTARAVIADLVEEKVLVRHGNRRVSVNENYAA